MKIQAKQRLQATAVSAAKGDDFIVTDTHVKDSNGNKATVKKWGTIEKAKASLLTLKRCENCLDCENCRDCTDCKNCTDCKACGNCRFCDNCNRCQDCVSCGSCDDCVSCSACETLDKGRNLKKKKGYRTRK